MMARAGASLQICEQLPGLSALESIRAWSKAAGARQAGGRQ